MNTITHAIETRQSISRYEAGFKIAQADIEELIRLASLAPSAYNFQNWKFIAVQSNEAKEKLLPIAYGQRQIVDAAVTFIIIGTLKAHESLGQALQPSVEKNIISQDIANAWVDAATGSHQNDAQLQRDEAMRSASLAAMTLMFAAQGMGFASGAMGGFDSDQLHNAFDLDENDIPAMLITVGKADKKSWAQKLRKPVEEVLTVC